MKWYEVQPALEEGKKLRRTSWSKGDYISYNNSAINYNTASNIIVRFSCNQNEVLADDWEIVEEVPVASTCKDVRYQYECPTCKEISSSIHADGLVNCAGCGGKIKLKRNPYDPSLVEEQDDELALKTIETWQINDLYVPNTEHDSTVPLGMFKLNGKMYPIKIKSKDPCKQLEEWLKERITNCIKLLIEHEKHENARETIWTLTTKETYIKCLEKLQSLQL